MKLMEWQRDRIVMPLFGWRRAADRTAETAKETTQSTAKTTSNPSTAEDAEGRGGSSKFKPGLIGKVTGAAKRLWKTLKERILEPYIRRFRKAFVFLPKKNGKSTLASCIALCLLVLDQEPGAEVYCAATDVTQANIVWGEAATMISKSEELSEVLTVHRHVHTVLYPEIDGILMALSKDRKGKSKEGKNIHGLIVDEFHAWVDRAFHASLKYGGAARRNWLFFYITTAGDDDGTLCEEEFEYAEKVRDGVIDDWEYMPVIYMAPKGADWKDLDTWRIANPSWGITIKPDECRKMILEALHKPLDQADIKRYRLNLKQQRSNPWLTSELWDARAVAGLKIEQMLN